MAKIIVTTPNTIFGDIVREFEDYPEALEWVQICLDNDLEVTVKKT
jgi:hypothetical protein